MANFSDQKPRTATKGDLVTKWGGGHPGERFRCYLCGHKFKLGDYWRWVSGSGVTFQTPGEPPLGGRIYGVGNFMVCQHCDGPDVMDRWKKHTEEAYTRFWAFLPD